MVIVGNITTTDRRDFPVPFGRMKHSIMPLRQILDEKFVLGRPKKVLTSMILFGILPIYGEVR